MVGFLMDPNTFVIVISCFISLFKEGKFSNEVIPVSVPQRKGLYRFFFLKYIMGCNNNILVALLP